MCENKVTLVIFYDQKKFCCKDIIKYNYYNPSNGIEGIIIITEQVYSVQYLNENNVDKVELTRCTEVEVHYSLFICKYSFDIDIQCPAAKLRWNMQQRREKKKNQEDTSGNTNFDRKSGNPKMNLNWVLDYFRLSFVIFSVYYLFVMNNSILCKLPTGLLIALTKK